MSCDSIINFGQGAKMVSMGSGLEAYGTQFPLVLELWEDCGEPQLLHSSAQIIPQM
jgi:hypothetical protein